MYNGQVRLHHVGICLWVSLFIFYSVLRYSVSRKYSNDIGNQREARGIYKSNFPPSEGGKQETSHTKNRVD